MLEECVFTPMPNALQRSTASLFVRPSSLASSWTLIFPATRVVNLSSASSHPAPAGQRPSLARPCAPRRQAYQGRRPVRPRPADEAPAQPPACARRAERTPPTGRRTTMRRDPAHGDRRRPDRRAPPGAAARIAVAATGNRCRCALVCAQASDASPVGCSNAAAGTMVPSAEWNSISPASLRTHSPSAYSTSSSGWS
jgi:hypothetical protein